VSQERIQPRFGPLVIKARFTLGPERREGYLTNVSEGGAFFAVDAPPPIGTEGEIRASLPWRLGELVARARVAWRSTGDGAEACRISGAGLAFESMDPVSRDHLNAYLRKFAELASRIGEMQEG
jgi:hypothetical protein